MNAACYLEAGGCSGPVCFYGSTDICDGNSSCDGDAVARCPDADEIQAAALRELNRIRSTPTRCGDVTFPMASSLQWSQDLFQIADRQALDMAGNNFIAENGSDGLGVSDRVESDVSFVRQSVAGGFVNTAALISNWVQQTRDCESLVSESAIEFGLACRYDGDSSFGQYWALVVTGG
jgi:uncharacterized protein YkwD